jgi:hypothetical protein
LIARLWRDPVEIITKPRARLGNSVWARAKSLSSDEGRIWANENKGIACGTMMDSGHGATGDHFCSICGHPAFICG